MSDRPSFEEAQIGMRQEGYLREKEYYRERWWDQRLFAILDHEWKAMQGG